MLEEETDYGFIGKDGLRAIWLAAVRGLRREPTEDELVRLTEWGDELALASIVWERIMEGKIALTGWADIPEDGIRREEPTFDDLEINESAER